VHFFSTLEAFTAWNSARETPVKSDHMVPSMFAPANLKELGMEKVMRLLPHDQDSGGFFVALFKKVRDVGEEKRAQGTNQEEEKPRTEKPRNKNEVSYEPVSEAVFESIAEDWGIRKPILSAYLTTITPFLC
jgi:hypothetical protein